MEVIQSRRRLSNHDGNIVWTVNINQPALLGLNISTGQHECSLSLIGAEHFISAAAGSTDVPVLGGSAIYVLALA